MKKLCAVILLFLVFRLSAQDSLKNNFTAAIDLTPFLLKGFSAKMGVIPKVFSKTEFAFEYFSMLIPETVVNSTLENANEGWEEKIKTGFALYADRKLVSSSRRNAFWGGIGLVHLNQIATNENETFYFQQLEYLFRINYKWYPFKQSGFYINPYLAFAGRHKLAGDNGDYSLSQFLLISSIYLSWKI